MENKNWIAYCYCLSLLKKLLRMQLVTPAEYARIASISGVYYDVEPNCV